MCELVHVLLMGHVYPPIVHHVTQEYDVIRAKPVVNSSPAFSHVEVGHYLTEKSDP